MNDKRNYKVSFVYLNEQHTCYYSTCASIRGARVLPIFSLELARNYIQLFHARSQLISVAQIFVEGSSFQLGEDSLLFSIT
jgi:hypothetical protein